MYQQIIILTLLVAVSNAQVIGWKNCGKFDAIQFKIVFLKFVCTGSGVPSPSQIKVTNCTQAPCVLVSKGKYFIDVDVNASKLRK